MLPPGTRIGGYDLAALLGSGGMGEVYRARDNKLQRDVAIKILPEAFAGDADRLMRFAREAQTLAALNHPNIAQIYGIVDDRALVMELVEGEDLSARIARGPMPLDEALPIARQIATALEAAHEQGIVHRDLKPANIKLRADGTVKVLDFGLAKALDPGVGSRESGAGIANSPTITSPALTMQGVILGTAAYMSPEQARGRPLDKRTDIWAFGCVLFEMLTGHRAFAGDDVVDVMARVVRAEPDWAALPASVPPHVVEVMRRCLAKDARQRFADIAVPLFLLDEGTAAPMATAATPTSRWTRALSLAAAALVGAVLAGAVAWTLRPIPVPARVTRFELPLADDQQFTNTGRQIVALSPDGATLVYVANLRLYRRDLNTLETQPIAGSNLGRINSPVFSPDGRELAFYLLSDGTLKRLSLAGGAAVTIAATDNPFGMSWDEQGLLVGQEFNGVLHVPITGGAPQVVARVSAGEVASSPQRLPNGRGVLFSVKKASDGWDRGRIVVQTSDGSLTTILDGASDGRYLPTGHLAYTISRVVMIVPFDLNRLATVGSPVPAIEGVSRAGELAELPDVTHYAVAANGSLAYVGGSREPMTGALGLGIFDAAGGIERLPLPLGTYRVLRVSPDGRAVAYETSHERMTNIAVLDLGGATSSRRLTFGGQHNRAPAWSGDGQWIAFQSDRDGDLALFRQRADGSGAAERLTTPEPGVAHIPQSWSPDGARLLFTAQRDDVFTLSTLHLRDRTTAAFGDLRSNILPEASFSPDGRWVLYQRRGQGVSGNLESIIEPFPSTGAKHLLPREGGHPYWSRAGDRVILNTGPEETWAIGVTTTPRVAFGNVVPVSRAGRLELDPVVYPRYSDMLPDGRIVGVVDERQMARAVTIVLNWFDELRALAPRP